jgi:hypothetical protein
MRILDETERQNACRRGFGRIVTQRNTGAAGKKAKEKPQRRPQAV